MKQIGVIVVLLLFVIFLFVVIQKDKGLHENNSSSIAKVYKVYPGYRGGINLMYSFKVEGIEYHGETMRLVSSNNLYLFRNRSFIVVYNKANPENNRVLIFSEDYSEFYLDFPDSLEWTERLKE